MPTLNGLWLADHLQAGDVLLYGGSGWISRAIQIKTWSDVSHCEVASPRVGWAWASRDGVGVGCYPVRVAGLRYIYRPVRDPDVPAMAAWFRGVDGQAYDLAGLFRFFTVGQQSTDRQFCSELAVRLFRAGGLPLVAEDYDADLVSPGMLKASTALRRYATVQHGAVVLAF